MTTTCRSFQLSGFRDGSAVAILGTGTIRVMRVAPGQPVTDSLIDLEFDGDIADLPSVTMPLDQSITHRSPETAGAAGSWVTPDGFDESWRRVRQGAAGLAAAARRTLAHGLDTLRDKCETWADTLDLEN